MTATTKLTAELARRMTLPQRHRLLQGYPMLPLHRAAIPDGGWKRSLDGQLRWLRSNPRSDAPPAPDPEGSEAPWIRFDATRPLIVGVLPHTQCNPKVAGCGFCTFPHDRFDKPTLLRTVSHVEDEIVGVLAEWPALKERRVDAVYFGGATANLTPHKTLAGLAAVLAAHFDLRGAEVTLEGVPSLFRSMLAGPFEALLAMPARHRRLSMGVQTFEEGWISRMGRQAFGDRRTVVAVVEKAHRHGMTISGDFLVNLPGQSREAMLEDMQLAAECGLDQICIYNLVLSKSTGAEWSKDPQRMDALPTPRVALDHWLAVRDWLLEHDFVQTTLTNFERSAVHATDRRFVYEEHSFSPDRYDALGVGPTSISTFSDTKTRRAVKLVRGKRMVGPRIDDLFFPYDEEDTRLLYVTRALARGAIDRSTYRAMFGGDMTEAQHFGDAIEAVALAKLAAVDAAALRLTPKGMFFADSVAGLLAWERAETLRARGDGAGSHTRDLLDQRMLVDFMG